VHTGRLIKEQGQPATTLNAATNDHMAGDA